MLISKTDQYALRAVLCLAQQPAGLPLGAAHVAHRLGLPGNYLSKILHSLARAGVLVSERGPRGGFRLARPPEELWLAEVIAPFNSLVQQRSCLLGRGECSDDSPCRVHEHWRAASDPVIEFFKQTAIADLLGEVDLCE
ncbi:MAG: Rrf2 family transcriptional regulator [Gemmatimonadota bacterium]|nr:MAG: Rrf2 family transcriptional regulator [Gemmatimonadota bacterium]